MVFDLNKSYNGKLERIITEHQRAVNRVAFHPTEPALLLSASQDGTMKIWDLRTNGKAKQTFNGKSESVRDVQFSPLATVKFASVFDNGSLQLWDMRYPSLFEKKW